MRCVDSSRCSSTRLAGLGGAGSSSESGAASDELSLPILFSLNADVKEEMFLLLGLNFKSFTMISDLVISGSSSSQLLSRQSQIPGTRYRYITWFPVASTTVVALLVWEIC